MHKIYDIGALLVLIIVCPQTHADESRGSFFPELVPDCIGKWACDDYCAKKEPCVGVPLGFVCDDYCAKKEPCVGVPLRFGCDDYCPKRLPPSCLRGGCRHLHDTTSQVRGSYKTGRVTSQIELTKRDKSPVARPAKQRIEILPVVEQADNRPFLNFKSRHHAEKAKGK